MTRHAKTIAATVMILVMAPQAMHAGEPNDANETPIALEFALQTEALGPFSMPNALALRTSPIKTGVNAFLTLRPLYAVAVPIITASGLPESTSFANRSDKLSPAQKDFLRKTNGLLGPGYRAMFGVAYRFANDPNYPRLLLYAMTEEDAKAMAYAYFRHALAAWRSEVSKQTEVVDRLEKSITTNQQRIAEIDEEISASQKALDALQQKVPYRTEKEASDAIAEIDRTLNLAQIDIAGIRSRIEAIQKYMQDPQTSVPALRSRLREMFLEESVALQGAQARREMATQLREDASRFLDLAEALAQAPEKKDRYQSGVLAVKLRMRDLRTDLERLMNQKPAIPGHPIPIYRVEWIQDDQTN